MVAEFSPLSYNSSYVSPNPSGYFSPHHVHKVFITKGLSSTQSSVINSSLSTPICHA